MCGRYFIDWQAGDFPFIRKELEEHFPRERWKKGEIFPTDRVPLLREGLRAFLADWGFPTRQGRLLINARVETAFEKPFFAESFASRRCIVPASGFFEWGTFDGGKQKYYFRDPQRETLYMGGIFREFRDRRQFVILTKAAEGEAQKIHSRMPLLLLPSECEEWIRDDAFALAKGRERAPQLCFEEAAPVDSPKRPRKFYEKSDG